MRLALSEVKSREAMTIVVTDCEEDLETNKVDYVINIQDIGPMTPLACVIPFQMITFELTLLLGVNPDKPRNLAKTVTVK